MSFTGRKGGRALETQELEITSSTKVSHFIDFIRDSLGIQRQPGPDDSNPIPGDPDPDGDILDSRIRFVSNMGEQNAVESYAQAQEV